MTDRKQLEALRDRLKAATGADYALSGDIALDVVGWRVKNGCWWRDPVSKEWVIGPPHFTGDIGIALTLRPDGAEYQLSTLYGAADFECPLNGGDNNLPFAVRREDGNEALAICQWRVEHELAKTEPA